MSFYGAPKESDSHTETRNAICEPLTDSTSPHAVLHEMALLLVTFLGAAIAAEMLLAAFHSG
jgi:hypothetical protein